MAKLVKQKGDKILPISHVAVRVEIDTSHWLQLGKLSYDKRIRLPGIFLPLKIVVIRFTDPAIKEEGEV